MSISKIDLLVGAVKTEVNQVLGSPLTVSTRRVDGADNLQGHGLGRSPCSRGVLIRKGRKILISQRGVLKEHFLKLS